MNSVKNLTTALFNSDARFANWRSDGQCTSFCAGCYYYLPDKAYGSERMMKDRAGYGNACNWYDHWGHEKGSEPKVGAIICWSKSDAGSEYGHVAVVTAINSDGTINKLDAWNDNGKHCINEEKNYNYHRSNVQGFVYIPDFVEPQPVKPTKTVEEVAKEVIAGKWGNGSDRKQRLEAAGYNYEEVQAKVNELLHPTPTPTKSVEEVAKEVIDGKWGNGSERKQKLEAAGYNYNEVQNKVNELLHSSSKKSVEEVAKEVIQGKWGNGADRKKRLTEAGYNYEEVQKKVNELC